MEVAPRPGTTRRDLLRLAAASAATAAALAAPGAALAAPAAPPSGRHVPPEALGMHLYTMRSPMAADPAGTLAALAAIGYRTVGVSGTYGRAPADFRALLDGAGLRAVVVHVGWAALTADPAGAIATARTLGARYLVISSLPGPRTPEAYAAAAAEMNRLGERARHHGLVLLYHNHDFDFRVVDGVNLYDVLLTGTDPHLVGYELDLYWAVRAGADPLELFHANPGRFPALHVKDMSPTGDFADVGSGVIDFARIFAGARRAGVKSWLVEHDAPASPLDSARASHAYLSTLTW